MDRRFDIDPEEFQERKRRRISEMNAMAPPPPKVAPTSAPGIHEIATFLPGRLEFEHELDNDAEDLVKDLEFGVCLEYGGDQIIEDEDDLEVRARIKWEEEQRQKEDGGSCTGGKGPMKGMVNGVVNGHHTNGDIVKQEIRPKFEDVVMANGSQEEEGAEEPTQLPPLETGDSLAFKTTLLEMYLQRVDKRIENKALMFNRGLVDYKKVGFFNCHIHSKFICPRCKLQRKSVHVRTENSFIVYARLPDYRQLKTLKCLLLTCFVSLPYLMRLMS